MSLGDHLCVTTFKRISLTMSGGVRDATYSRTVTRHSRRPGHRPSRPVSSTKEEHHAADLKPQDSLVTREHPVATHCPRCNWARAVRTHGNGCLGDRGERGGCLGYRSVEWRIGRAVINHLQIEDLEVWRMRVEELDAASSRSSLPGAPSPSTPNRRDTTRRPDGRRLTFRAAGQLNSAKIRETADAIGYASTTPVFGSPHRVASRPGDPHAARPGRRRPGWSPLQIRRADYASHEGSN